MRKFIISSILAVFMIGAVFVGPVSADLTLTNKTYISLGNKHSIMWDVAFDSSYRSGGEILDFTKYGFRKVDKIWIQDKDGYSFEAKYTSGTSVLKVFTEAPPMMWEEKHELQDTTGNTGFILDYPAAFIVNLVSSGGTNYPIIYSSVTSMSPGFATLSAPIQGGVRTGISIYPITWLLGGNTNFYVTYVTQAWQDVYELLVQNELMTGTGVTRHTISGNTIFGWGWAKQDGALTGVTPIDLADTAATGEMGIDYGNNALSGATQAYNLVPTGTQQYYATYLKEPEGASWIHDRWINDEDAATGGTSLMQLDRSLLLWLTSGYGFSTGDSSLRIVLEDQQTFFCADDGFLAANCGTQANSGTSEMFTTWGYRGEASDAAAPDDDQIWSVYDDASMSMTHAVYLYGHPWEIPNLVPLEVPNGRDLSNLTGVRIWIIGR